MAFESPAHATSTYSTLRKDLWWLQPASFLLVLGAFVVYATWRVFENANFGAHLAGAYSYESPFASPDLTGIIPASWSNAFRPLAYPAFLILPVPAGFRFTCYYFRRVYYRSFVSRPAACAVEANKGMNYKGERGLLIFQNLHRYFLYLAIAKMAWDTYEVLRSFYHEGHVYFGLGVVILALDIAFLAMYVFGCHAFRHLVGGRLDCFSCDAISMQQHSFWKAVTKLNEKHGFWAMLSLVWVAFADLYVRYLAMHPGITTILGVPV